GRRRRGADRPGRLRRRRRSPSGAGAPAPGARGTPPGDQWQQLREPDRGRAGEAASERAAGPGAIGLRREGEGFMAAQVEVSRRRLGGLSDATRTAAREALDGRRKGLRAVLPFAGPAFIASVAYMDPGNFATNIQGGALYGYRLLWVVVFANLTAMLFQSLSAKLGIATGKNLAELSREHFSRPVSLSMWGVSEIAAMATDLAEFLGATIALNLLFGFPLLVGAAITGVATYAILTLQRRGFRPIEAVIGSLVGVMA